MEVFVDPAFQGMRLGRRLYDARKELAKNLNLKGILLGGRIPGYHKHSAEISPEEYILKVQNREIHDPVLTFQISNDFHVRNLTASAMSRVDTPIFMNYAGWTRTARSRTPRVLFLHPAS
ncbi:MAG: GNAT family N-acetyltransferase [Pseudomonadota bacterium]